MESSHLTFEANKILRQRNIAILVCIILLASNFLLSLKVFFGDKEIILIPNSLNHESSIVNGKMSFEYMEAFTRDVVNLMLNVSPSNVEYSSKSILRITHPKFYGTLKTELNSRSQDIINRRIAIHFYPKSIIPNEDENSVYVVGQLSTYLGKEEVSNEEKTYSITYASEGFKPLVIDFHEVNINDKNGGEGEKIIN